MSQSENGRKTFCGVLGFYSQMRHSSTCVWHYRIFLNICSNDKVNCQKTYYTIMTLGHSCQKLLCSIGLCVYS